MSLEYKELPYKSTNGQDYVIMFKVARLDFFREIPPKFEHYLHRHE